jgi:hypothetical protein
VALAGPTALAFFAGGYFAQPRAWAGLTAWAAVLVAALAGARPPRARAAAVAVTALALLAIETLLSTLWAPIAGNAYHAAQIVFLYLAALVGAAMIFRDRSVRLVEPALAGGVLVVIGYGLSERFLPGLLHFTRSVSAEGRLEQPLTYWNAIGELAALGFVLCARLAGDGQRPAWLRAVAAAAAPPLGLGLYISFSRGALFACLAGLVALVAIAARREQLGAVARTLLAGALASAAAAPFGGVTSLAGSRATREGQGALVLGLLVVVMVLAAVAQVIASRRERRAELGLPRHASLAAAALTTAGLALAIVVGAHETSGTAALSGGATRLVSLQSNRYAYWHVALRAFAQQPIAGVGAGGWSVYWLRWRPIADFAQDAHSLPLQTLAELGLIGLAVLLTWAGAIAVAARDALRRAPAAAGMTAALVCYLAHSPLDWDWQMPAVTLVAVVLAGAVLGLTEPRRSAAPRG